MATLQQNPMSLACECCSGHLDSARVQGRRLGWVARAYHSGAVPRRRRSLVRETVGVSHVRGVGVGGRSGSVSLARPWDGTREIAARNGLVRWCARRGGMPRARGEAAR